jgi:hypothetical protein
MSLVCNAKKKIGISDCSTIFQNLKGFIYTPKDFSITATDAADQSKWQDAIQDTPDARVVLFPQWAIEYENVSEESVNQETSLTSIEVRPGNYRFKYWFTNNMEQHKSMYSFNGAKGRVFPIDRQNIIVGTSQDDGVTLQGLLLDRVQVDKLFVNDGSTVTYTPVTTLLADNTEVDDRGVLTQADFVNDLIPLTPVVLATSGTPSDTEIIVDVSNVNDGIAVEGLDADSFSLTLPTGVTQTISGAAESAITPGRYTLSGTSWVTGLLSVVTGASPLFPYESRAALTVTIA